MSIITVGQVYLRHRVETAVAYRPWVCRGDLILHAKHTTGIRVYFLQLPWYSCQFLHILMQIYSCALGLITILLAIILSQHTPREGEAG